MAAEVRNRSWLSKMGWIILLGMSALIIFGGVSWYISLPELATENIAEYAGLDPSVFMQGEPSASDVIAVVARGYGAGYAALGLMALLVALEGYRNGPRWAWRVMWVLALIETKEVIYKDATVRRKLLRIPTTRQRQDRD